MADRFKLPRIDNTMTADVVRDVNALIDAAETNITPGSVGSPTQAEFDTVKTSVNADLLPRLNTAASSSITFAPGSSYVSSPRDRPFNLSTLYGRTLLNLLGRVGNCEVVSGWTVSGTVALDSNNVFVGTNSLRLTAGSAGGAISRTVNVTAGATYILAAALRPDNGTTAYVTVSGIADGTTATNSVKFSTSYMRFTATAATHTIGVVYPAAQGKNVYVDGIRLYEVSAADYSQLGNTTTATVEALYPYTEGIVGVKNPYIIRWANVTKLDISGMLAFETELLSSVNPSVTYDRDQLDQSPDGHYYKTGRWNKVVLDGSIPWVLAQSWAGYKAVAWLDVPFPVTDSGVITKFDKTTLSRWLAGASATSADSHVLDGSTSDLWITVATADSGWGDSYSPSVDDIKAYFYGWKMYDASISTDGSSVYNRTDGAYKAWCRRTNGFSPENGYADGSYTLPTTLAPNFLPYEMLYKRGAVNVEPVAAEGALNLLQGDNYIDVGSGVVLRESAKPQLSGSFYLINGATTLSSALSNRVLNFLQVYRNGRVERWQSQPNSVTGGFFARLGYVYTQLSYHRFDPASTYSVTYLPANYYATVSFTGTMQDNERALIDDLIRDLQQTTRRVSIVEMRKNDQDMPEWIYPSLLNGVKTYDSTSNMAPAYRKSGNTVYLGGVLTNASTDSVVFRLPAGYRPIKNRSISTMADGLKVARIFVNPAGDVMVSFASPMIWITLDGLSFTI